MSMALASGAAIAASNETSRCRLLEKAHGETMRITIVAAAVLLAHAAAGATTTASATTTTTATAHLAKPPPAALHFTIMSSAGKHGESMRWTAADGTRKGRESFVLRGQVFELDSAAYAGNDGMLDRVSIHGFTPNGDAAESFVIAGGRATWKSPVDGASAPYAAPAFYVAVGGPIDLLADLVE